MKLNLQYPDDSTQTGPLLREGTSITVSGYALEATLVYDPEDASDTWQGWGNTAMYRVSISGFEFLFQPDYTIGDNSNKEGYLSAGSTIHCFFLFKARGPPKRRDLRPQHIFLVLSRNDREAGIPIFERIGLCSIDTEEYMRIQDLLVPDSTFCIL